MSYKLLNPNITDDIWGTRYLPKPCNHLIGESCPLKAGQNVTNSANFQLLQSEIPWTTLAIKSRGFILQIDFYEDINESINKFLLPVFILETKIQLEPCFLHFTSC